MTTQAKRPIIKDDTVFGFNYVPPSLPHRTDELAGLHSLFSQVVRSGVPQTAFLTGPVGTGKTVLAKKFCSDLESAGTKVGRSIIAEVINCRNRDSPPEILHRVITSRFQEHLQERGFSVAQMLNILRGKLQKGRSHLVLVLDEANALLKKGPGGPDLVYNLTRFDEDTPGATGSLSLILVSQLNIYEFLDAATASTFKRSNTIVLKPYGTDELTDILLDRARLGLHPGTWGREVLQLAARLAASEGGDARRAIETLHAAARKAEDDGEEKVRADHIHGADAAGHGGLPLERLDALEEGPLLVGLAIARAIRDREFLTTGEAEQAYAVVCEETGRKRRAHTQFWKYLKVLDAHGVIDTGTAHESSGTTTAISLHDITPERLEEMLGQLLGRSAAQGGD
jgi:cell division control protein 6